MQTIQALVGETTELVPAPSRSNVALIYFIVAACGGAERTSEIPGNEHALPGTHEVAKDCFEIDHESLDRALAGWSELATGAKLQWLDAGRVPRLEGTRWPGVAFSRIEDGSIFARMGLRDGDVVYGVNGWPVTMVKLFVDVLSDPARAAKIDARPDSGPRDMLAAVFGESAYVSLVVLRAGESIAINQVRAGAPRTGCDEIRKLNVQNAEEAAWTWDDWQRARTHDGTE